MSAVIIATIAFQQADDAWGDELHRLFGKKAGDIRYTAAGKGIPGSELRRRYEARETARIAWDAARGYGIHGERLS